MKYFNFTLRVILLLFLINSNALAQFNMTGSTMTVIPGPGVYNLTPIPPTTPSEGALWSTSKADFSQPFDLYFDAQIDMAYNAGADGICVVFGQMADTTWPTVTGGGIGYYDPSDTNYNHNSFAVEFDTYYNATYNDIEDPITHVAIDHVTISKNAGFYNTMPGAAPVQIDPSWTTIKDNVLRHYKVSWDPATKTLRVYCNCILRIISVFDYQTLFTTPTTVEWGFTSSTGASASNHVLSNIHMVVPSTLIVPITQCGGTATLNALTGFDSYVWSPNISTTNTATVSTSGIYSVIWYDTTTCSSGTKTYSVNILPVPGPITGPFVTCEGVSVTLSDAVPGGTWDSDNPTITIDPVTGVVSSASTAGTALISYTQPGGCLATTTFTVNPTPGITGPHTICLGSCITLSASIPGGTWSITGPATIDPSTGVACGSALGSAIASYTLPTGCSSGYPITIYPKPDPITGPTSICVGAYDNMSDAVTGGSWSSGNTGVATIDPGSGHIYGVATGTAVITYMLPTGCFSTFIIAVGVNPIGGKATICTTDGAITLTDATPGGTWTSSSTIVSVDAGTGVVTGHSSGTAAITYTTVCGSVTFTVTVASPRAACVCSLVSAGHPFSELGVSGTITAGTYSGNFFINHNVIVTGNVVLTNCTVIMAVGVRINVSSGAKLTIQDSHLGCCYPDMWQGIILNNFIVGGGAGPTGQLQLIGLNKSTMIEDARVAVDIPIPVAMPLYTTGSSSTTNLTLYSNGCIFNKNTTGIHISNYLANMSYTSPSDVAPSYPFLVENTIFTCRNFPTFAIPFAWPATVGPTGALKNPVIAGPYTPPYQLNTYPKTTCNNHAPAQYGVDLFHVGFKTGPVGGEVYSGVALGGGVSGAGTDLNLYDNLQCGINALISNVLTRNSGFMNIVKIRGMGGDGIFARSSRGQYNKLHVYGASSTYTNTFWNNVNCVEASDYYDVIGVKAVMSSQHATSNLSDPQGKYGYKLTSSQFIEELITDNTIYNMTTGISITTPSVTTGQYIGQTSVNNNTISSMFSFLSPSIGEYIRQGIEVYNLVTPVSTGVYSGSRQNIDNNTIKGVYNGILVDHSNTTSHAQSITTNYNNISMAVDPTLTVGSPNQTGIIHTSTESDYIDNNIVTGVAFNNPAPSSASSNPYYYTHMTEGIHVGTVTAGAQVGCNQVIECNTGFYFGGHSVGVTWLNNTMMNNAYGFALDGDIGTQGFIFGMTGNVWSPSSVTFGWGINGWQMYTIGLTDAAMSPMFVHNSAPGQQPIFNSGESPSYYVYATYGLMAYPHPILPCVYPESPSLPEGMMPGGNTGTEQVNNAKADGNDQLAIIPNPNNGTFELKGNIPGLVGSKQVTLEVYDVTGRTLFNEQVPIENGIIEKKIIIGGDIADGVYFMKIRNNEINKVVRFSITR